MLPIYILLSLVGAGYYISKNSRTSGKPTEMVHPVGDEPSMKSIYDSDKSYGAERETQERAAVQFQKSREPYVTGVVSKNYTANNEGSTRVTSRLTGVDIPKEKFTHNNMMPYFRGSIRQSLNENASASILSNQTGVDNLQFGKREVENFSDYKEADIGNMHGSTGSYQLAQDRMVQSTMRNNAQPAPMLVGPGLNKGYGSEPSGGYQQADTLNYIKVPTVDELRVATNPKVTYKGRTVDGQGVKIPAVDVGEFAKNRVDTFFENTPERYFTTVGANTKDSERPEQLMKCTAREVTSTESYQGGAYANRAMEERPDVEETKNQNLCEFGILNANPVAKGRGEKDDYSRSAYKTYTNARDVTACAAYDGNLISLVKAWVAPFTDVARSTTKEYTTAAARQGAPGIMSVQIPGKLTVHDPNDIARTTIKETLIHDQDNMNLKGATLLTVYDPDDVARVTTRQTLPRNETTLNMGRIAKKSIVYDPNDVARTTIKETTIDNDYVGGSSTTNAGNAYIVTDWDAKTTQKQFLSDREYEGNAYKHDALSGAYQGEVYDMKATQKQFTSDNDYYGASKTANADRPMSHSNIENAVINNTKDILEHNRDPTQTNAMLISGVENVRMDIVKRETNAIPNERMLNNKDFVRSVPPSSHMIEITKHHKSYVDDARLDPSILEAYKKNPFTHSLSSTR